MDMTVYNPYTEYFTLVTIIFMFEANGLIDTTVYLDSIRRFYYSGVMGFFRLGCEMLFCLLLIFYTLTELNEIR